METTPWQRSLVIEAMEWLKCSCGGEEVEKAFDKPEDLIPTQLALAIHSVDKADRNLEQWRVTNIQKGRVNQTSPMVRPNCLALTIISIWKTYPLETVAATNFSKT